MRNLGLVSPSMLKKFRINIADLSPNFDIPLPENLQKKNRKKHKQST